MIRFNNDYSHGAHPDVLRALAYTNDESYGGYGMDEWCEKAASIIKKLAEAEYADVHFLVGGTQANFTVIASALRPYESIISADSGHINVHETGAVENSGHKILALKSSDGKITADQIEEEAEKYRTSDIKEHITEPKMVYISFPTEYGTIYSKKELKEISEVCHEYNMYLFVDGARLGYGLGSVKNDVTLKDISEVADVFYIGGTKCGALFGEALVITEIELQKHFRSYMKQNGALLAKGWLLGLQFATLLEGGLYFKITKRADDLAMQIKAAFERKSIPFYIESFTNQQFVILNKEQIAFLEKDFIFENEGSIALDQYCVRFCTSWYTKNEDVRALISAIESLP